MKALSTSIFTLTILAGACAGFAAPSQAGIFSGDAGRTAVWVYVKAYQDEDVWETCRRVYQRDVYQVRGAGRGAARCYIDASRVGDPRGKATRNQGY